MPWDQEFWTETIDQIQASLSTWLPAVFGAILLLIAGWITARFSQAAIGRLFRRLGLDRLAERTGVAAGLTTIGVENSLSFLLARMTYWLILIFFILLALGAVGLSDVVSSALNSFFVFLPRLVSATIIFLVGAFIARVVGDAVSAISARSDIPSGQVLGQAIRYSLLLLVVVLALDELGVQTTILTTLIIVAVAAIALGLALSFGLGNRQLARGIMAGFHAREEYTAGQRITVGGYTGRLLRIGATKTHMETSEGRISIPNTMLLDEVVKIYPGFDGVEDSNAETSSGPEDTDGK